LEIRPGFLSGLGPYSATRRQSDSAQRLQSELFIFSCR
jgi:hypothetical protein